LRNPPQLSTCRYRKEDFDSWNALFGRLKLCKHLDLELPQWHLLH
jgi:hypothetical protein